MELKKKIYVAGHYGMVGSAIVRILKKDVMGLKRGASSYWINRENKIQTMKKQF